MSPTTYHCAECGKPATVEGGEVIRTCEHDGKVIANIEAVATGQSQVK